MSAFLPLQDPDHPSREVLLRSARDNYQYSYTHVSPLAILDRVPFKDEFSVGWLMHMAERVAVMFANRAELEIHEEIKQMQHGMGRLLTRMVSDVGTAVRGLKRPGLRLPPDETLIGRAASKYAAAPRFVERGGPGLLLRGDASEAVEGAIREGLRSLLQSRCRSEFDLGLAATAFHDLG